MHPTATWLRQAVAKSFISIVLAKEKHQRTTIPNMDLAGLLARMNDFGTYGIIL